MIFVNEEKGTVVAVLGKEGNDCTVEALEYVARKVAKTLRTTRSMDKLASFGIALYLLRAVPVEKYVKPVYTGKAQLHTGVDKFDLEFGKKLATARARRAYWQDVAAYMIEVEDFLNDLVATFSFKVDGTIGTATHFDEVIGDLHAESEQDAE